MLFSSCYYSPRPSELVMKSIGMVLNDEGFKVPSPRATEALEAASKVLHWCKVDANKNQLGKFSKWLVVALKSCFNQYITDREIASRKEVATVS